MDIALIIVGLLLGGGALAWWLRQRGAPSAGKPPSLSGAPPQRAQRAIPPATPASEPPPSPQAPPSAPSTDDAVGGGAQLTPAAPPSPPTAQAISAEEARAKRDSDIAALRQGLAATRGGFVARLASLFRGRSELDESVISEVEEVLLTADLGVKTADRLVARVRDRLTDSTSAPSGNQATIWRALREEATEILGRDTEGLKLPHRPSVIVVVGVNGVGKTTTIGKLASRLKSEGKKIVLAAGDTFRAAAVLQLEVWGRRVDCPVVRGKERADPGSVIFDAIKQAQEQEADVVIADTAGRLHTKAPLMDELKKVGRTVEKALGRPADEVLLVLDSTTGQNAVQQAQLFSTALPLSGLVLTKLDGTAKGGVVLGVVTEHGIPIRYIGVGERVEDLRVFSPEDFVEALFENPGQPTPDGEVHARAPTP